MKILFVITVLLSLLLIVKPASAFETDSFKFEVYCTTTKRSIPVYAFYPKISQKQSRQFPLILHIHGYGGDSGGSSKLNSAIAAAGYVVVSPSMVDLFEGKRINGKLGQMYRDGTINRALSPFIKGDNFDHKATGGLQRIQEARWLLDYFTNTSNPIPVKFKHLYNPNNVAMSGHSFGGYTTLGVAGIAEHSIAKNLKAILLYSPGVSMWKPQDYKDITVPMMIQWGETELRKQEESLTCFHNCSGPSYLAIVSKAGHFAWTDQLFGFKGRLAKVDPDTIFQTTLRLSLDFFDGYLKKNKSSLKKLTQEQEGLSRYEYRNLTAQ